MRFVQQKGLVGAILALLLGAQLAAAALVTFTNLVHGTTTTLLTLSSLANDTRSAAGTTFDPLGTSGLGYRNVTVECVLTFGADPTANTTVDVWFLKSIDGTNFEDVNVSRLPDVACPVTAGQVSTRVSLSDVRLPPHSLKGIVLNNATGQTITSGTIKILPVAQKGS